MTSGEDFSNSCLSAMSSFQRVFPAKGSGEGLEVHEEVRQQEQEGTQLRADQGGEVQDNFVQMDRIMDDALHNLISLASMEVEEGGSLPLEVVDSQVEALDLSQRPVPAERSILVIDLCEELEDELPPSEDSAVQDVRDVSSVSSMPGAQEERVNPSTPIVNDIPAGTPLSSASDDSLEDEEDEDEARRQIEFFDQTIAAAENSELAQREDNGGTCVIVSDDKDQPMDSVATLDEMLAGELPGDPAPGPSVPLEVANPVSNPGIEDASELESSLVSAPEAAPVLLLQPEIVHPGVDWDRQVLRESNPFYYASNYRSLGSFPHSLQIPEGMFSKHFS